MVSSRLEILQESKLKRKRLKRARRITLLVLFCLLLISLIVVARAPFLNITQVEVQGETSENETQIADMVKTEMAGSWYLLIPKTSIFLISPQKLEAGVAASFPRLGSVQIVHTSFNKLVIKVGERKTKALWCLPGQDQNSIISDVADNQASSTPSTNTSRTCYFIDDKGILYASAPNFSGDIYLEFEGKLNPDPLGKPVLETKDFENVVDFITLLPDLMKSWPLESTSTTNTWRVDKTVYLSLGDFQTFLQEGETGPELKVIFNKDEESSNLANNLSSVLTAPDFKKDLTGTKGNLDYIDLRFGQKVFYKFK